MNTKLHAVTDANRRPLSFFMTAGQVSDYIGAAALLDELPKAQWLLADRDWGKRPSSLLLPWPFAGIAREPSDHLHEQRLGGAAFQAIC